MILLGNSEILVHMDYRKILKGLIIFLGLLGIVLTCVWIAGLNISLLAKILLMDHVFIGAFLMNRHLKNSKSKSIIKQAFNQIFTFIRRRIKLALIINAFTREIVSLRPDIVHCHDVHTLPVGAKCKKRIPCKVVYDSHEIAEHQHGISKFNRIKSHFRQRNLAKYIDGFITVNDSIADYLNQRYPAFPKAVVIRNATLPMKEGLPSYDGRLHHKANLSPETKVLLFQGGFAAGRGLKALVRSANFLPDGWALVMMGKGYFEEELRKIYKALLPEVQTKVRFIPFVPQAELLRWTSGATVGTILYENVCMNHWFCSPNKLWEYPAAGVPILASDFPEMSGIINQDNTGWLVPSPITPSGIGNIISSLTEEEIQQKKSNCFEFIRKDNWSNYASRLVRLYSGFDMAKCLPIDATGKNIHSFSSSENSYRAAG